MTAKNQRIADALKDAGQSEPQQSEKKRASPKPSPETEALRAMRKLRQLEEQRANANAYHRAKIDDIDEDKAAVYSGLSGEALSILKRLNGTEESAQ